MLIRELTPQTTHQQLFDYITAFLLRQGRRSANEDGICAYRGEAGLMCAVGCIIPDELYSEDLEDKNVRAILYGTVPLSTGQERFFMKLRPFLNLLWDLQEVHDSSSFLRWKEEFSRIAANHGLEFHPELYKELP